MWEIAAEFAPAEPSPGADPCILGIYASSGMSFNELWEQAKMLFHPDTDVSLTQMPNSEWEMIVIPSIHPTGYAKWGVPLVYALRCRGTMLMEINKDFFTTFGVKVRGPVVVGTRAPRLRKAPPPHGANYSHPATSLKDLRGKSTGRGR